MKSLTWLIETDVFSEDVQKETCDVISKLFPNDKIITSNYAITDFKLTPPQEDVCIIRGSFGLVNTVTRWLVKGEIKRPFMFNFSPYNFTNFAPTFKHYLLSEDFRVCNMDEVPKNSDYFVRPNSGNKTFSGNIYTPDKLVEEMEYLKQHNNHPSDIEVVYSSVKNISEEYRCIVIGGNVIDSCYYNHKKEFNRLYENKTQVHNFVANLETYLDDYVIDICLSDGKLKVLECNCILTSSYYDCDRYLIYPLLRDRAINSNE